jgi:DNA repair protein RadA/Sms
MGSAVGNRGVTGGAKTKIAGRCEGCGAETPKWVGRCPECGEWGSVVEIEVPKAAAGHGAARSAALGTAGRPVPIAEVDPLGAHRRPTGIAELDRVLGGGLVNGSVTLVGGEPGMGKSTLMLQALGSMAAAGARVLLVSAEESAEQVRLRAERLGAMDLRLSVVAETSLPNVLALVSETTPDVLVIDSIQTVFDPDLGGVPGSMSQVRDCAHALVRMAKSQHITTLVVGHVTKEGNLAGPRLLEHVVDTVLQFEGDRHHGLRMLRALKHRFGATDELGLFEMTNSGLVDVRDASAMLLTDRCVGLPGSVVAPMLDGSRPLLVEVQALVSKTVFPMPRRSAQAFDNGRLSMLAAIMQQRLGIEIGDHDIYGSIAGGVRIDETGADLAMLLAMTSAKLDIAVRADTVALGEVGLGGEVRSVAQAGRRLSEAARLGFRTAVVPASTPDVAGLALIRVDGAKAAIAKLFAFGAADSSSGKA